MKKFKHIIGLLFLLVAITSCQEEDFSIGDLTAPSNIQIVADVVGADADNPNGDGSGKVNFTVTADNALSYHFIYKDETRLVENGKITYNFSDTGLNTYTVNVVAYGKGGNSSSKAIQLDVLALYEPPADLLKMLVGDGTRTWRIKAETGGHFGLGPVGDTEPNKYYGASAFDKAATGMYDDRYIFNADGTFTHITNSENDNPNEDTSGTVFGRKNLIDELGPHSETPNGDDIENYPYNDYSETWSLSAPDGVETLSLSGLAFMGYYTGGNHQYQIFSRSANEMLLRTTDGNGQFDWWFLLTATDVDNTPSFETQFSKLLWADEFNTDGAPDATKWTYDLGNGTNGWGNNEAQTYTNNAENVIVANDVLKITAKTDGNGGYTSARLKTQDLFKFKYGRVEVRAKLPAAQGTWPAIWMLGSNFPDVGWPQSGEIDIMEQTGASKNEVLGTLHWSDNGNNASASKTTAVTNSDTEFHNYTVEWREDKIFFLVDNEVYHEFDNNADLPFNQDFFMILNVAMGGTLGGTIDSNFTESSMEIDYVRVYQK